ncbi:CocE/NonD family hydrolase [Ruegeria sp.]|uniref:CocE/NonD family hydrolase n=1 Tax=Ruegeria sp. TaxID=1879320 RepID=UPI003B5AFE6B
MTGQPEYPFGVSETDHLWITMSDGVRLAARLWRPVTRAPVPAILEYIPYRKTDMVRARDERNHPYFAAHGYACIRVDMRGSGDSEGHMPDMYAPAELDDARHVIEWLATQPWCNGRVGMFGTSWGGTASLQASVDAPAPLKAAIAVCATHDRFEDDIHYMGGCVLSDTFEWGATLPSILASPPSLNVGPEWKSLWKERIDNLTFPLENWLREDGRGDYWRHGSVIHTADALSVPILSVGGWSDRYSNSVMSLVDARPDLVWGVVGPWGHHYPDHGSPGPAIGFQKLALEWWDHWLKSDRPDTPDWPRLRVWMREFDRPGDSLAQRTGRWAQSGPASQESIMQDWDLSTLKSSDGTAPWRVPTDSAVGQAAGETGYFGRPGGLPLDQTEDDARSLVFETAPLVQDIIIYGSVTLALRSESGDELAQIIARLSDVNPEGVAARVSFGVRNLSLDENLDRTPSAAKAGEFNGKIRLHSTAYCVRKGHSLRLALSSSYWPLLHAKSPALDIQIKHATLHLPVLPHEPVDLSKPLPPAQDLPEQKRHSTCAADPLSRWTQTTGNRIEIGWHQPLLKATFAQTETTFSYETSITHSLETSDVVDQQTSVRHKMGFERPDGTAEVSIALTARTKGDRTTADAELNATWNNQLFAARQWRIL